MATCRLRIRWSGFADKSRPRGFASKRCRTWFLVGTGYTYLQDYLPHVAQAVVAARLDRHASDWGAWSLSYPELPADGLQLGRLARKRVCRTFSDCTTAPRNHLVSGCYPLDPYYKTLPEAETLKSLKRD